MIKKYEFEVDMSRLKLSYNVETEEEAEDLLQNDMHIIAHILKTDFKYEFYLKENELNG